MGQSGERLGTRASAHGRRAAAGVVALLAMVVSVVFVFAPPAGASSVSNVTAPVLSSPASAATAVEYEFQFTVSTAMTSASTVTVSAPARTVLTGGCDNGLFNITKNLVEVG